MLARLLIPGRTAPTNEEPAIHLVLEARWLHPMRSQAATWSFYYSTVQWMLPRLLIPGRTAPTNEEPAIHLVLEARWLQPMRSQAATWSFSYRTVQYSTVWCKKRDGGGKKGREGKGRREEGDQARFFTWITIIGMSLTKNGLKKEKRKVANFFEEKVLIHIMN